jgi:hypothetical protein
MLKCSTTEVCLSTLNHSSIIDVKLTRPVDTRQMP